MIGFVLRSGKMVRSCAPPFCDLFRGMMKSVTRKGTMFMVFLGVHRNYRQFAECIGIASACRRAARGVRGHSDSSGVRSVACARGCF